MTPEMAVGHSLQHINLLYEAKTSANAERSALRLALNQLQAAFHRLQQAVVGAAATCRCANHSAAEAKTDQTAVRLRLV
ncbi:MAG: hypothetical protein R3E79_34865 [Caldilineaceae bacterium]